MTQTKKENSFLFNFLTAIFFLIIATLFINGLFNIVEAAFTSYTATAKDVIYFLIGITTIGFITCIYILDQVRQNMISIAASNTIVVESLIKLLNLQKKNNTPPTDYIKDILKDPTITGFTILDLTDPKFNQLNQEDFEKKEQQNEDLIKKFFYKGKSNPLKKEMPEKPFTEEKIKSSTIKELNDALDKAIEKENFLLAATIRDEIKLREEKN